MRLVLVSFVSIAALAAGGASSASSGETGCAAATARAAILQARPWIPGPGGPMRVTPGMTDRVMCFDMTGDGRADLAASVASGGTAGDIGWFALVRTETGWRRALGRGGYKLSIARVRNDVLVRQPVYRKNDPNCCPSGGFAIERWHWNGHRFVDIAP